MSQPKHLNHIHVTLAVTPPPPKTWKTPSYHLENFTIRRHVYVVTVQLHGIRGKEKRTETISFPLLPGVSDTELVRAAVWFSPNNWTPSFGMNVSQFQGNFSRKVDEGLIHTLMNHPGTKNKRQASSPASTPASFQRQPQSSLAQTGQFSPLPQQNPPQPPSFYSQPTQTFPGQFPPPGMGQPNQPPPGQYPPPPTYPQAGQFHHAAFGNNPMIPSGGTKQGIRQWYKTRTRNVKLGLGCGMLILVLILCSAMSAAFEHNTTSTVPTPSPTSQVAGISQTAAPTQQVQATNPPVTATPTLKPTATPTPKPTVQPTTAKPTPHPATPTPCPGINCNPWGYNFSPGRAISTPPSNFCSYFNCITSFWEPDDPDNGYVVQCGDGTYSQSGGERGACSSHSGVGRTLYSH